MSTILDSLKKSSDERNDNSKSSIDNFKFGNSKNSRGSQSFLPLIILIILTLVIGYFSYQYLFNEDVNNDIKSTPVNDELINSSLANDNVKLTSGKKSEIDAEKIQKPNSDDVKQKIQDLKNKNLQDRRLSIKDKKALESVERPVPDEINLQVNGSKNSTENNDVKKVEIKKEPVLTLTMPREKDEQESSTQITKQKYLYIYQLPFSVRKDIPQIKLNIHVYDKDPANRIVIINGVKLAVGDLIENEILLKEIIQDGVVLEYHDNEFLIPK